MIGVIDYGIGNTSAFLNVFQRLGVKATTVRSTKTLSEVDKIILPGVGHFGKAITMLWQSGLSESLEKRVREDGVPILGVCVGMQMFTKKSDEADVEGLNWIQGHVKAFPNTNGSSFLPTPHMGWNKVDCDFDCPLFKQGFEKEAQFYFLHSYCFSPAYSDSCIGVSDYHGEFVCAVKSKNVYGFQFHPEKSLANGIRLLTNFASTM